MLTGFAMIAAPAAAKFYVLAGLSQCPQPRAHRVDVNVTLSHKENPTVTTLSSAEMTAQFDNDPDSTSSTDGKWMVGGLNKSSIQTQYKVRFDTLRDPRSNRACFSIKSIDYNIIYENTIFIARDFLSMGCRYSATMAHEKRHVNTDLRVLRGFRPYAQRTLKSYAENLRTLGPFSHADMPAQQQRIVESLSVVAKPLVDSMIEKRRIEQAKIDTYENYKRDTALCPGQFPQFDGR